LLYSIQLCAFAGFENSALQNFVKAQKITIRSAPWSRLATFGGAPSVLMRCHFTFFSSFFFLFAASFFPFLARVKTPSRIGASAHPNAAQSPPRKQVSKQANDAVCCMFGLRATCGLREAGATAVHPVPSGTAMSPGGEELDDQLQPDPSGRPGLPQETRQLGCVPPSLRPFVFAQVEVARVHF
jgi:hypothetical protein